jgi:glycosyltransferase involved in cell wall biosynthesis
MTRSQHLKILIFIELVDMFISPSHFLANRFIQWGIPSDKMRVIENGRPITESAPHRVLVEGEKRNVFGYFGQINPYKGILVILEAVRFLVKNNYQDFRVEIFGNVALGFPDFADQFLGFLHEFKDYVNYNGQYKLEELKELIQPVDWVIVPSTWWENSPLVIQEVFMHKRPIICSNIGGMAEKVEDQVTGLHFRVGNAVSLAKTMQKASSDAELWQQLVNHIKPRLSIEDCLRYHTRLYDHLS